MDKDFVRKVLIVAAIALCGVFVFLGLKAGFHILLLVFAGVLVAVYFRKVGEILTHHTKLNHWQSLTVVIIGTLAIIIGFIRGLGSKVSQQTKDLQGQYPTLTQSVSDKLSQHPIGRFIIQEGKKFQSQSKEGGQQVFSAVTSFFSSTFGALGDLYIVLILSIYFTATPSLYKKTFLNIFPRSKRERAAEIMEKIYDSLGKWIIGQLIAMVIVAVATGITLGIMGVPFALLFALIAGGLNFIPNFGPLIAMVPAALVALTVSPSLAIGVIIAYIIIQNIEGEFITPLIQQRMVELPPAYIILFQVFMAVIAGGIGIVMATPLLAAIMVLIQELYIKPIANKE